MSTDPIDTSNVRIVTLSLFTNQASAEGYRDELAKVARECNWPVFDLDLREATIEEVIQRDRDWVAAHSDEVESGMMIPVEQPNGLHYFVTGHQTRD